MTENYVGLDIASIAGLDIVFTHYGLNCHGRVMAVSTDRRILYVKMEASLLSEPTYRQVPIESVVGVITKGGLHGNR